MTDRFTIVFILGLLFGSTIVFAAPIVDPVSVFAVSFESRQSSLPPAQLSKVQEAVEFLKRFPSVHVWVDGHADATEGSDADCQRLSEVRARVVYDWLVAQGHATQLQGRRGFGKSQPVDSSDAEEHRRYNRRVEIHVAD